MATTSFQRCEEIARRLCFLMILKVFLPFDSFLQHCDNNEVLKALCAEAGWTVEPDGTTYKVTRYST